MDHLSVGSSSSGLSGCILSAKSVYDAYKKANEKMESVTKKPKKKQTSVKVKELAASAKKKEKKKPTSIQKKNINKTNTDGRHHREDKPVISQSRVKGFLEATQSLIPKKGENVKHSLRNLSKRLQQEAESDSIGSTDEFMDTNEDNSNNEQSGSNSLSTLEIICSKTSTDTEPLSGNTEEAQPVYDTLDSLDYEIINESEVVAFVPFKTCFYFKGRLQVIVLSGCIEMLGYVMEEDYRKIHDLFSPRGYSLNCIRSLGKSSKISSLKAITAFLAEAGFPCDEQQLQIKSSANAIVLIRPLDFGMVGYTSRLFGVNILRKEECTPPSWEEEARQKFEKMCGILDTSILLRGAVFNARFYQQPDIWYDYTQQLIDSAKRNEPVRLMLLGGKGVGKSTLLRYIVNRLIQNFGSVLVMDFDPGQPELFPAGCVSASLITEPLLGPNFTHFQQPIHCYHIGEVDVTACPDRYVQCCHQLLNDCKTKPSLAKVPTLINTMGFTTGMGLDLALDLIRLSQPLQVLQITSRSPRRNYVSVMDHEYVTRQRRGWMTSSETASDRLAAYDLQIIYSASEFSEKCLEEWGFRPRELREIGLMSYFGKLSGSSEWTLTDATPYQISWHALAICVSHESIPPSQILAAINASLVALCILDGDTASSVSRYQSKDGNYPSILKELPIMPCIGYGIVRNVDMKNGHIYLVTPEPIERLERVNCLVMGGVQLPDSMLLDQPLALQGRRVKESVHVPYATCGPSGSQPACRPYRRYNPMFTLRNHV